MFYINKLKTKTIDYVDKKLQPFSVGQDSDTNQNILALSKARLIYNYLYQDGALRQGYGFKSLTLPTSINSGDSDRSINFNQQTNFLGLWQYNYYSDTYSKKQYALVLYGEDKKLYWCKMFSTDNNIYTLYDKTFNSLPTVINYRLHGRDILIFCSPDDNMLVWDGDLIPYEITTAPTIRSMCLHNDRLFAITQDGTHTIRYSKNLDPTDWLVTGNAEDSGLIEISDQQGGMNKILSFLGYIFIFRDYAITKLAFYDEDGEYNISQLYFSGSKIFSDTVCVCGNKILLLSNDGLYSFDGVNTSKISLNIDSLFNKNNNNAYATFYNGKYYLACKLDYNDQDIVLDENTDGYVNNTLLVVDAKTYEYTLTRGVDILSMLAVEEEQISKLLCLKRISNAEKVSELTYDGCYYGTPLIKKWKSTISDLGFIDKAKIIKEIFIYTEYNCSIKLITNKTTKTFDVLAKEVPQRIRVNIKDKLIGFEIISNTEQVKIQPPTIRFGVEV